MAIRWAEHGAVTWAKIFGGAIEAFTDFSSSADVLPAPSLVPDYDTFLEGSAKGRVLRGFGTVSWHIQTTLAGLVDSGATVQSECLLGVQVATSVHFANDYPQPPKFLAIPSTSQINQATEPSSTSPFSAAEKCVSGRPNFLAALTLAWTYILSAYWSEIQGGSIVYTNSKATQCHNASVTTIGISGLGQAFLFLDDAEITVAEVLWWRSVLARPKGWEAKIERDGETWFSPWSVLNADGNDQFVIVTRQGDFEPPSTPLSYEQSLAMLKRFVVRQEIWNQANMALMAALCVPTHNLWSIPVSLPRPIHRFTTQNSPDRTVEIADFQRSISLFPRLVTISSFGVEGLLQSAFYDDSIHSLHCGQWIDPAMISWPDSSTVAAEVGCQRSPASAKWWIGMAISGLLSKQAVKLLIGAAMWPTNLVLTAWTGAKHSYVCSVLEREVSLTVSGKGHWRTIPRSEELLMLFITSGQGPEGRLREITSCPWKPPGDILFENSDSKVVGMGSVDARARLIYNTWRWGERSVVHPHSAKFAVGTQSQERMVETSGTATRAVLGWLEDIRGSEADLNVELQALQHQIQMVEDDSQVGGSDHLSDSFLDAGDPQFLDGRPLTLCALGGLEFFDEFVDAELIEPWYLKDHEVAVVTRLKAADSRGWCGLDAINIGLEELSLSPIPKTEALKVLVRTEEEIVRDGMCVRELEVLLNTRGRTIAVVESRSGRRWKLLNSHRNFGIVNVEVDVGVHFRPISQGLER
jgi:hypothetical protein